MIQIIQEWSTPVHSKKLSLAYPCLIKTCIFHNRLLWALDLKQAADVLNCYLAELDVFKVTKIKILINICMFNAYSKTVAWLSAWKKGSTTTVEDIEQTSMMEAKGIVIQALGYSILNPATSHCKHRAMHEWAGTIK